MRTSGEEGENQVDPYWNIDPALVYPREMDFQLQNQYQNMPPSAENLYRKMKRLEKKLDEIARLTEENNRLLQSIANQTANTVVSGGGGGTVVVRM